MRKWVTGGSLFTLLATSCSFIVDTTGLIGTSGADASTDAGAEVLPAETTDVEAGIDELEDAAPVDAGDDGDARTDAEVVRPLPPGLVAAWSFEGNARDVTGHGHDGTTSGCTYVNGKYGQALDFGLAGEMFVPGDEAFDRSGAKAFSVTAWVKLGAVAPSHSFVLAIDDDDSPFGLEVRDATRIAYYEGPSMFGDGHVAMSTVSFAGRWSHLALVVAGPSVTLYFDGAPVGRGTADTKTRAAAQITLGTSRNGDHLSGAVDNVRYYARALDAAEVVVDRDHE